MRLVQFELPTAGRRLGVVDRDEVLDLTSVHPHWLRVVDAFSQADQAGRSLESLLSEALGKPGVERLDYGALLRAAPGGGEPYLHPPVDHPDPHRLLVAGTGLTHLGSMQSRNQMHAAAEQDEATKTDSARMFDLGLRGGKPTAGERGTAPEWFYKGNGTVLRGPGATLEVPAYARDGGEEAELVGCYVIDRRGRPRRLGFALGNEWSDHATEKINYLYLAPSKLRQCAVGPELATDFDFQELKLSVRVTRAGEVIYDSGELLTGERHMCHALANCEDHHFKYPQHRVPGDVHLHYFGTSKLSHGTRDWTYQAGDELQIDAPGFSAPLVNRVVAGDATLAVPVKVDPA